MPSLSIFQKIWQKLQKNVRQRQIYRQDAQRLIVSKEAVLSLFKDTDKLLAEKIIDEGARYLRMRSLWGKDMHKFTKITDPRLSFALFALYAGIDLEKKIQKENDIWMLDGIKLPLTINPHLLLLECPDIIYPSFFRRHMPGFEHFCAVASDYIRACESREGPYELGNVYIAPGDIVFDCGANVGMFSAVASRYGAEKVYAFEAIPDLAEKYVSKVAELNGKIEVVQAAVWDKEETLDFSLVPSDFSASRANQYLTNKHKKESLTHYKIPAITLDAFAEKNEINRVDFIKADIEGAERNMLRGAKRILQEFAPKLAICTYHLPDDPQVLRDIVLAANPKYQIVEMYKKMYAYVPK